MKSYFKDKNFLVELVLSCIIISVVLAYIMSPILLASNESYPYTSDAMGHLTKVKYMADSFKKLQWPSWFPYWYNGSHVMQYYPPLSYLLMAPIQMIWDNVMITYKCFCFLSMFIGSVGVWYSCYYFLGRGYGILGSIIYACQPFLISSLMEAGVLAQGPVFAISPWFVLVFVLYIKKPDKSKWSIICVLTTLLILSHAMHAFMICACMMFALIPLYKKINLKIVFSIIAALGLGCSLAAAWWLPGVTKLENPTIPYLLEEAALMYTANLTWFFTAGNNKAGLYFGFSLVATVFIAVLLYLWNSYKRKEFLENEKGNTIFVSFNMILFFITIIFSFGQNLPFFKFIPLYRSLVPGRILSLSSLGGAVIFAYFVFIINKTVRRKRMVFFIVFTVFILNLWNMGINNPKGFSEFLDDSYKDKFCFEGDDGTNFQKGRYNWIESVNCSETYFPMVYDFNISDGWNIEGTPHNRAIWNHNIALVSGCENYVIKNLLYWNVRKVMISNQYQELIKNIMDIGFIYKSSDENGVLLYSDAQSSYFLKDNRDALVIGKGAAGAAMEFPWLVQGRSNNLEKYSQEELQSLKLIYIVEPEISSERECRLLEESVRKLLKNGKTVIIEFGTGQNYNLFGVTGYDVKHEGDSVLAPEPDLIKNGQESQILFNGIGQSHVYTGLDEVYYFLNMNNNKIKFPVIGTKYVDNKPVYFIGMTLSKYLKPAQIIREGFKSEEQFFSQSKYIKNLLETLFDKGYPYKGFVPDNFLVQNSLWSYKGCSFQYKSQKDEYVTISVTYTPHWQIKIDGEPVKAYNRENLVVVKLPAGNHKVTMNYGITWVGKAGIAISIATFIICILIIFFYKKFMDTIGTVLNSMTRYMQIH